MSTNKHPNESCSDTHDPNGSFEDELTKCENHLRGMTSELIEDMRDKLNLLKMSGSYPDLEEEYRRVLYKLEH